MNNKRKIQYRIGPWRPPAMIDDALPVDHRRVVSEIAALIREHAGAEGLQASSPDRRAEIERQVASSVSVIPDGRVAGVSMRACGLPEFPALLRRLPELEQIDLSGNRIAALP